VGLKGGVYLEPWTRTTVSTFGPERLRLSTVIISPSIVPVASAKTKFPSDVARTVKSAASNWAMEMLSGTILRIKPHGGKMNAILAKNQESTNDMHIKM